jgi:hypothetical protein
MAIQFADGKYGTSTEPFDPNTTAFSAAVWLYADAWNEKSRTLLHGHAILRPNHGGSGTPRSWLYMEWQNSTTLYMRCYLGGEFTDFATNFESLTGQWMHAALTVSGGGAGATSTVYLNGTQDGQNVDINVEAASGGSCQWGTLDGSNTDWQEWYGRMAEGAIWNAELSANEVSALANGVSPSRIRGSNLVTYIPFGIGSPDPDFSGNGYNATLTGSPVPGDHPPVGPQFGFDGGLPYTTTRIPVFDQYYRRLRNVA